ncbi:hypothetical protein A2Y99_04155 [Candidatus Gottesmanbacteria bacterium RBG_13_37_7]|uniref:R3H domain-containing protein n=1 Tax=Candidatus Gottesmanbacteria bacterium RBG_13_37_7 TaxID=1798369 RepID=A0A1F5YGF6_9BACT|nr:MAG: hypothetical protein A2Y99_04155 [Candidatus Gottesmanbacteria bacterium RBG_13_37_7]
MREKKQKSITDEIELFLSDLFAKLQINVGIEIVENKSSLTSEPDHYIVSLKTEETGLLIGRHGEILNSLQLITGIVLYKKLGKWVRVVLDIGDYRKTREASVKEMAMRIVKEVEESNTAVTLPYLTPLERRAVHVLLTDHQNVETESVGEGKDRRLIIKPRVSASKHT